MQSIKAPTRLSYRATKADIESEAEEAGQFMESTKDAIVKWLENRALENKEVIDPARYRRAASNLRVKHRAGRMNGRYGSFDPDKLIWAHVWAVPGGRRSPWGHTDLVIRKDGTVNTEYLTRKIAEMAWAEHDAAERNVKKAAVKENMDKILEEAEISDDYKLDVTSTGVYVTYAGEHSFREALRLRISVPPEAVMPLIAAHQKWVDEYMPIIKGRY